jgi:hypothetical protein
MPAIMVPLLVVTSGLDEAKPTVPALRARPAMMLPPPASASSDSLLPRPSDGDTPPPPSILFSLTSIISIFSLFLSKVRQATPPYHELCYVAGLSSSSLPFALMVGATPMFRETELELVNFFVPYCLVGPTSPLFLSSPLPFLVALS